MKAEDLGAIVAHNKALQFLLVDREVASFDIEVTPSRKAKHILTLGIPGHAISIGLLRAKHLRITIDAITSLLRNMPPSAGVFDPLQPGVETHTDYSHLQYPKA